MTIARRRKVGEFRKGITAVVISIQLVRDGITEKSIDSTVVDVAIDTVATTCNVDCIAQKSGSHVGYGLWQTSLEYSVGTDISSSNRRVCLALNREPIEARKDEGQGMHHGRRYLEDLLDLSVCWSDVFA